MSEQHQITKAATIIGTGTLLSRIFGCLRDMVIAYFFGAGMAADAFFVAFRLPNLWRRLVGEGSLTISFIPVYTDYLTRRTKRGIERSRICRIHHRHDPAAASDRCWNYLLPDFDPHDCPPMVSNFRKVSIDRDAQPDYLPLSFFHGTVCPLHGDPEFP